jgi:transposase InsO family protein
VHSVCILCRVLKISRSAYYAWSKREPSRRQIEDEALLAQIVEIHQASRETYGVPRVHAVLRRDRGVRCSTKRVWRLMRQAGIHGVSRRRPEGCTRRNPHDPLAPDLVQRQFTADAPNLLWVADITQHPTGEGWLYAAAVLDVFSRKVIGWSMSEHLHMQIVLEALNMAVRSRRPVPGRTIHHSDHGAQYTAMAYGQRLKATGLVGSMGSVGDAYDNALMESFWASLQTELLDRQTWPTRSSLRAEIFEYIEGFYNPTRAHSSLDMLSPNQFERRWLEAVMPDQPCAS